MHSGNSKGRGIGVVYCGVFNDGVRNLIGWKGVPESQTRPRVYGCISGSSHARRHAAFDKTACIAHHLYTVDFFCSQNLDFDERISDIANEIMR